MTKFLIAIALLTGCTSDDKARRILESQGMTHIEFTGYRFSGCSDDDHTHTGFEAMTSAGTLVSGVVCCGLGPLSKGCTIRFD